MKMLQMAQMPFSFRAGWDEIARIHPSIARLFVRLVLPLSLLPPALLYYAGGSYGEALLPGVTPAQWQEAAGIFLVAELLTVPLVAWLIHLIARLSDVPTDYHVCFTLAAIAPVPLWLSALVLLVPNLIVVVTVGGLALLCSVQLIYHGVYALFGMREDLRALQMATVVAGAGLFAWLLLMQIVLRH